LTNAKPWTTARCNAPEGTTHVYDGIFDHVCVYKSANVLRSQYKNPKISATAWWAKKGFHTLKASMLRRSRLSWFRLGRSGFLGGHKRIVDVLKLLE